MAKQSVLVATENKKAIEHLTAYFQDTESIPAVIRRRTDLAAIWDCNPDMIFIESEWADSRFASRLMRLKSERPSLKCFTLGAKGEDTFSSDGQIGFPIDEREFRKVVFAAIKFPRPLKLVVVDDEREILDTFQDYFEVRRDPEFLVQTAANGLEGFKLVEQNKPHCLILDLKMPVRSGVELYRDLARANIQIPTVIFIDSTASDDILEIRKWGVPVFVEKEGKQGTLIEMHALVKKLVAFS